MRQDMEYKTSKSKGSSKGGRWHEVDVKGGPDDHVNGQCGAAGVKSDARKISSQMPSYPK